MSYPVIKHVLARQTTLTRLAYQVKDDIEVYGNDNRRVIRVIGGHSEEIVMAMVAEPGCQESAGSTPAFPFGQRDESKFRPESICIVVLSTVKLDATPVTVFLSHRVNEGTGDTESSMRCVDTEMDDLDYIAWEVEQHIPSNLAVYEGSEEGLAFNSVLEALWALRENVGGWGVKSLELG